MKGMPKCDSAAWKMRSVSSTNGLPHHRHRAVVDEYGVLDQGPADADSDEAAPLFRDDCAPGFRDDLAPCVGRSAGDDCCQFIQARCQALRGRFRRRLSPLNSMRWALWTNLSSMASA
ncbi:hypothetical protein CN216_20245 [Sinorhizobium meliloti]|nr:hypothetical protein CN216_20245 [Sinorhizobium meliloti]